METMHKILIMYTSIFLITGGVATYSEGAKKTRHARRTSKGQLSSPFTKSLQKEIVVDEISSIELPSVVAPDNATSIAELTVDQEDKKIGEQPPSEQISPPEEELADIVFNFENADLQNLISYMETLFNVTFIPDDVINPILQSGKAITGNKISFKTQRPLTKKQAWALFETFLDMAGLALFQEGGVPAVYRITTINNVKKSPIPAFIGVDSELLPDNDTRVRYIYFIENTTLEILRGIVDSLRSSTSSLTFLQELRAFMLTDSAYNIKVLMRVVKELDKITMPQAMSVLKLKRVDALRVKALYDALAQQPPEQQGTAGRVMGPRKLSSAQYFPEDARIIAEPRTNSLILLGSQEAISKIEDFIIKHIDIDLDTPYSPLHIFPLKYAEAETVAAIMNSVAKFGQNTPAAQGGGVRGLDKYLKPMSFTAETISNRIIVRGDYDDFLKAKEVMEKLDEPQPQIAIEVLILSVFINEHLELGSQIRSKTPGGINGLVGDNVKFQTSGLRAGGPPQPVITNPTPATGNQRLLGDLINLVVGKGIGNTIVSLGTDPFGIWGIFQALEAVVNTQVISNPFLIATNKTPAEISLGETRRVVTGVIKSATSDTNTLSDDAANLTVKIIPQINSDGMIILNLNVSIATFISPEASPTPAKTTRSIDTSTIVADKEVLALGGLLRNRIDDNVTQVPILGNIPILGWLFKNKRKLEHKECLLILLSTKIIEPFSKHIDSFTKNHLNDYQQDIHAMRSIINERDVIDRTFFKPGKGDTETVVDTFIFKNNPELKKVFDEDEQADNRIQYEGKSTDPLDTIKLENQQELAVAPPEVSPPPYDKYRVPLDSSSLLPGNPLPMQKTPTVTVPLQVLPCAPEVPGPELPSETVPIADAKEVAPVTRRHRPRMSIARFADSYHESGQL
jgi:general secretion pathway protein D